MVTLRQTVKFPAPRGFIAAPPRAYGAEFEILAFLTGARPDFEVCGNYAVVDICGPLSQHGGFESYDGILKRATAAFASGSDAVALRIDSPGGDFAGAIELSRDLRQLSQSSGKPLYAFSDSQCLSAAYAIACAAESLTITPSAFVGSIGVWAALGDTTAADKAAGQNIIIVSSGDRKLDHNPHVPVSNGAVEALQKQVNVMAGLFFAHVSGSRGLAAPESFEGAEVLGGIAVSAGLADRIVNSWSEFVSQGNFPAAKSEGKGETPVDMNEVKKALSALADGGSEEAKKMLAGAKAADEEKEEEPKAAAAGGKALPSIQAPAKGSASDDDEMPESKKEKAASEKEEPKAAAAGGPTVFSLAAELHAMKAAAASDRESAERATLLASRPDFSKEIRATLSTLPLSAVREACSKWARIGLPSAKASITPGATQGAHDGAVVSDADDDFISKRMGGAQASAGVSRPRGGRELELGFMTPGEAAKAAAALSAKEGAK